MTVYAGRAALSPAIHPPVLYILDREMSTLAVVTPYIFSGR